MIRIFWLSLIILCVSPLSVFAGDLRIATVDLVPYGYWNGQEATGLCFELANAIAQEAGLKPVNTLEPLARGIDDIASGRADMIIMHPHEGILVYAVNLGALLPSETVAFGRAQTPLRTLDDLKGKVVAFVRGTMDSHRIESLGIIPFPLRGYEQGLKMLLSKRVDAIVGPKLGLYYTAQKIGLPRRAFGHPLLLCNSPGSVFLSKRAGAEMAAQVSAALERLRKNGTVQRIVNKYCL